MNLDKDAKKSNSKLDKSSLSTIIKKKSKTDSKSSKKKLNLKQKKKTKLDSITENAICQLLKSLKLKKDSIDALVSIVDLSAKDFGEMQIDLLGADSPNIDYEAIFSYMKGFVASMTGCYGSYFSYNKTEVEQEENFFEPGFGEDVIKEVIHAAKMKNTYGIDVYVNPLKVSFFDSWKLGNSAANKLMYDLVFV